MDGAVLRNGTAQGTAIQLHEKFRFLWWSSERHLLETLQNEEWRAQFESYSLTSVLSRFIKSLRAGLLVAFCFNKRKATISHDDEEYI